MDFDRITQLFAQLSFREAVWLFPFAFTLHVLEEVRQFTAWANHQASSQFTFREYLTIYLAGIVLSFIAAAVISLYPNRVTVFLFFTFMFTPGVFYNIFFHAGATAWSGAYCPGLLTALTIYPPLFYFVSRLAFSEGLLTNRLGWISLVLAGLVHAADVSRNVFRIW
ncbi:MAG TPA: HXXEE domain-containing protein [Blastocatellia bacterium]|nr:HXXEE domain-containing protein [Blastocatellia bacterium]